MLTSFPTRRLAALVLLFAGSLCAGLTQAKVKVRQVGTEVEVEFQYRGGAGGAVVAGSFNDWSVVSAPMTRNAEGLWVYVLRGVKPTDVLQYKFVVGTSRQWVMDPEAPDVVADGKGGQNGLVAVRLFLRPVGAEEIPGDIEKPDPDRPSVAVSSAADVPATAVQGQPEGGKNLLANPGFETGSLDGWVWRGDATGSGVEDKAENAHGGSFSIKYWFDKPFKVLLLKRFTGLKNGTYAFKGWMAGAGGEPTVKLFARDCGGATVSTTVVNSGWKRWKQYAVRGIRVTQGSCTLGLYVDGQAGQWGNLDDVEFYEDATFTRITAEPVR